jgi:SAM-dependent methyltransferase
LLFLVITLIMAANLPSVLGDPAVLEDQIFWDRFSATYTEHINKAITIQATEVLHAHMELASATNVLEIGAAGGLGTLDILQRVDRGKLQRLLVTDVSPNMLHLTRERLQPFLGSLPIEIALANGKSMLFLPRYAYHISITHLNLQRNHWREYPMDHMIDILLVSSCTWFQIRTS